MSASIGETTVHPAVPDVPHAADVARPAASPEPSGPPISSSTAAVSGGDSTTATGNADGSITTTMTDILGNIVSTSTNPPAARTGAGSHPLLNIEA